MSDKGKYLIFGLFILLFEKENRSLHGMGDGIWITL